MRRITRSIIAVGLAVLGMMATNTPPASAANGGTVTFSVILRTPPLSYPPNNPQNGGVSIHATEVCAAANVGKDANAGACVLTGAGNITGLLGGAFCGQSEGTIWGSIRITGPLGTETNAGFHVDFVTAGGGVVITGTVTIGSQTGPITGEAVATPTGDPATNPGGGSCLAGTATEFRAVGEASYAAA